MKNSKKDDPSFNPMNIGLKITKKFIEKVNFEIVKADEYKAKKTREVKLNFKSETYVNSKNKKAVKVRFFIVIDIEKTAKLDMEYDFEFNVNTDLSKEIAESDEFKSKTLSMAYPYIKTFAEQFVSMSGVTTITLPFLDVDTLVREDAE